jgi:predicted MFS family arabinose efflux permease
MISIVMSGVVLGILIARLLAGIVTQFTAWRNVYWISFALQALLSILLFLFFPDYPILRQGTSYPALLWKIVKLPFSKPVLTQASLNGFMMMGLYTCFWTTLTFQLAHVFNMATLTIGLFALIGLAPVLLNPVVSRLLTARIHPSGTQLIAHTVSLLGVCIGTFVGSSSLAGPIIWAFLGDLGMNTIVVANRMAIVNVDPKAQNAVNSVYMVFTFAGQLFGTATGNALYARGGWTYSGGFGIALCGVSSLVVVARGPHETGWFGWGGGWDLSNKSAEKEERRPNHSDVEENGGVSGTPSALESEKTSEPTEYQHEPNQEGQGKLFKEES